MPNRDVKYFVFDIESVADGNLVSKLRYGGQDLGPEEAVAMYREELLATKGSDFIPYTFHIPVSIVIAKVDASYELVDLVSLDEPSFRPHVITENFWRGWDRYQQPTLVSFNGRTFDVPLLELACFRYGISVEKWFNVSAKAYDQQRNRYNTHSHFDLLDLFTNYGATRFNGGLNLAANLIGKPGKMEVQGDMVQDLYQEGRLAEIDDYCRCDVLDTYFVFLRSLVMIGRLTLDREKEIVETTKRWLEERAEQVQVYRNYLDGWGSWTNPWSEPADTQSSNHDDTDRRSPHP